jgi:hypothetical protein
MFWSVQCGQNEIQAGLAQRGNVTTHRSLARSIPTHLVPGQKTTQLINVNETLARQGVDNDAKGRR